MEKENKNKRKKKKKNETKINKFNKTRIISCLFSKRIKTIKERILFMATETGTGNNVQLKITIL